MSSCDVRYAVGEPTLVRANEFITMNAINCISISYDMEHHTDILRIRIAESCLRDIGLMLNVNPFNIVNIWAESASVTAADNTTGSTPAGTVVQNGILATMRQAKLNNVSYAVYKLDLSQFDLVDPALFGKLKVLDLNLHFADLTTVPFF
jgi:hypothetical protein